MMAEAYIKEIPVSKESICTKIKVSLLEFIEDNQYKPLAVIISSNDYINIHYELASITEEFYDVYSIVDNILRCYGIPVHPKNTAGIDFVLSNELVEQYAIGEIKEL